MDHLPDVHFRNVILVWATTENRCCGLSRNGVFKLISLWRKILLIQNFFLGSCTLKSCCFLSLSEILSETIRPFPKAPFSDWWFPSLQTTVLLLPLPWLDRSWQEKSEGGQYRLLCSVHTAEPSRVRELCFMMLKHAREASSPWLWLRLWACCRSSRGSLSVKGRRYRWIIRPFLHWGHDIRWKFLSYFNKYYESFYLFQLLSNIKENAKI